MWFRQVFGLLRVRLRQVFGLLRVRFKQVSLYMILEIMGLGQKPQTKNQDEGLEGIGFCPVPRNYCYYFIFIILT